MAFMIDYELQREDEAGRLGLGNFYERFLG